MCQFHQRAAFMLADPYSKKGSQIVSLFALLGSARAKAALRMLLKLTQTGMGNPFDKPYFVLHA